MNGAGGAVLGRMAAVVAPGWAAAQGATPAPASSPLDRGLPRFPDGGGGTATPAVVKRGWRVEDVGDDTVAPILQWFDLDLDLDDRGAPMRLALQVVAPSGQNAWRVSPRHAWTVRPSERWEAKRRVVRDATAEGPPAPPHGTEGVAGHARAEGAPHFAAEARRVSASPVAGCGGGGAHG